MKAWRIDSLDAKAGFAFTSLRDPWSDEKDTLDEEVTVLFQPPDFSPQRTTSPAIALAAARGSFQLGLYADERSEVSFPDLESVREFVRRLFLRSSGGDFPPADEGPPTPLPDQPETPDEATLEPLGGGDDEVDPVKNIIALLGAFEKASEALTGSSAPSEALPSSAAPFNSKYLSALRSPSRAHRPNFASIRLCRAGMRLLAELLHRAPRNTSNTADWNEWLRGASPLARTFDHMQLWPLFVKYGGAAVGTMAASLLGEVLKHYDGFIADSPRNRPRPPRLELCLLRHLMLTGWSADPYLHPLYNWGSEGVLSGTSSVGYGRGSPIRAFDTLARISIPPLVAKGMTQPGREVDASLRHLLVFAIALPQGPLKMRHAEAIAELLLFAACWLTSFQNDGRLASYPHEILFPRNPTGAIEYAELNAARIVEDATYWLARNFTTRVFAPNLEQMIDGAIGQRSYAMSHA